jgi:hypothetical protein
MVAVVRLVSRTKNFDNCHKNLGLYRYQLWVQLGNKGLRGMRITQSHTHAMAITPTLIHTNSKRDKGRCHLLLSAQQRATTGNKAETPHRPLPTATQHDIPRRAPLTAQRIATPCATYMSRSQQNAWSRAQSLPLGSGSAIVCCTLIARALSSAVPRRCTDNASNRCLHREGQCAASNLKALRRVKPWQQPNFSNKQISDERYML